uniref:Uncharacterized protein n=1 Tax=Sphaerodactylus townsendi TaxID=933632 RepID=A0ACB8F0I8_9SAUR
MAGFVPRTMVTWPLLSPFPPVSAIVRSSSTAASGKKQAAKSKEELAQEKKKELEKRLQDVSGQLNNNKKPAKKARGSGCSSPIAILRVGENEQREKSGSAPSGGPSRLSSSSSSESGSSSSSGSSSDSSDSE